MARTCSFILAAAALSGVQAGSLKLGSATITSEDADGGAVTCDGSFPAPDVHAAGETTSLKDLIAKVADLETQLQDANAVIAANVDTNPGYRYWRIRFDSNAYSGTRAWYTWTEVEYFTADGQIPAADLRALPEVGKFNAKNEEVYRDLMYDGVHGPYLAKSWSNGPEDGTVRCGNPRPPRPSPRRTQPRRRRSQLAYGLDFGTKIQITEARVVGPSNNYIHYLRATDAHLEYSDNGLSWHVAASHINVPAAHGTTAIMTVQP